MMSRAKSFASMAQQLFGSFGVGLTTLIVHASLLLHGGTGIQAGDVSPAFLFIGLLCGFCLFIYLRLPANIGADVSGRSKDRAKP
jgi:hypothetical protein